jgi:cytochrome P450 family 110
MPFGGGVRRCIGYALAQYEMRIVVSTILTQLNLELVNKSSVSPRRKGVNLGLNAPVLLKNFG